MAAVVAKDEKLAATIRKLEEYDNELISQEGCVRA